MTYKTYKVLVFPCGTGIGLEINDALRNLKEVRLFGAVSTSSNHGPMVYRRYYGNLPWLRDSSALLLSLNELIEQEKIDCIFPAYDDAIVFLAEHQQELGARVISSPFSLCTIARSKARTYDALRGCVPIPHVFDAPDSVSEFPVFVKPDRGQGSHHAKMVCDELQLRSHLAVCPDPLILEYLPGAEYTVDCFSDRERGLLFIGVRQRIRVCNGISVCTRAVDYPGLEAMARAVWDRLPFHGAWFFQAKLDVNGNPKLLEVAPRIAGAMALFRNQGINFPLLSIYEAYRVPIRIIRNNLNMILDKGFVNRFQVDLRYSQVYVDLDDTLILDGQINVDLVAFLYQCLNRNVQLILITSTVSNPAEVLAKHRLIGLFDEIIHVPRGEKKSAYIAPDSIFIDDSFAERQDVFDHCHIPVFDCDMIESLLDYRR